MRAGWLLLLLVASWRAALADEIPCTLAEDGVIVADGLFDDWEGQPRRQIGNADAGIRVYCNYSDRRLFLGIELTDERIIGTAKRLATAEDHALVRFGNLVLTAFPGNPDADVPSAVTWSDKQPHKNVKVVAALQQRGWGIELAFPLAELPGYGKGVPSLPLGVELHDADLASERSIQAVLKLDGQLAFQEADALLREFLTDFKLKRSDLKVDQLAEIDREPGTERVIAGGKVVAVLKDGYAYVEIAAEPRDVLEVKLVELIGARQHSVLVRSRERGGGGSREVLAVWNMVNGRFTRTFAHEIAKEYGGKRMTNNWTLRKAKRGGKVELVIVPGASSFTQAEWNETPAEDMQPILLPWGEKKEEVWTFQGSEVLGG